jgi:acetoin utilization deacetylase AcuC-like enzyme
MTTLLLTHPAFRAHETTPGHPERSERMRAVEQALGTDEFSGLQRARPPMAALEDLALVHPESYIEAIRNAVPKGDEIFKIDPDTSISAGSWEAALRAVGAATHAIDQVMTGKVTNAFCAVRPPGHHAQTNRAMGFCLFSNAAIAAQHVRKKHGAERVAVVDFDVHHGNGTQEIFWADRNLFYGSTHQMPLFPGTGAMSETGEGNIFNAPLQSGDGSVKFRASLEEFILPGLEAFSPDFLIISAGFDAHRLDPLGGLELEAEDFGWATKKLMEISRKSAGTRVISLLEGGYDLEGLSQSAAAHVKALMAH